MPSPLLSPQDSVAVANLVAAAGLWRAWCPSSREFLRHVVVSPGSRSTPLVATLAAMPGFVVHIVLDERVAAFVALGIARATGQAAVLLCTSGSAGAHYLPACIEAFHAQIPLLLVTANRPSRLQACGAAQTTSQRDFFGTHVRACFALPEPMPASSEPFCVTATAHAWWRFGHQALMHAQGDVRGPVHLDAPFDEPLLPAAKPDAPRQATALWENHDGADSAFDAPRRGWPKGSETRAPSSAVRALATRLQTAKRGIILCGPLLGRDVDQALRHELEALSSRLGWPLLLDAGSQLRFCTDASDETLPHDVLLRSDLWAQAHPCDAVLRLGHPPTSKATQAYLNRTARGCQTLIEPSGAWLDAHGVLGGVIAQDELACVRQLLACLPSETKQDRTWHQAWIDAGRVVRRRFDQFGQDGAQLWEGAALVAAVRGLSDGARLHISSSLAVRDLDTFGTSHKKRLFVSTNRGVNGIDGTLSTALGLCLAQPDKEVVLIVGDLAFLHDLGALQAARQMDVRLLVVVIDNHGGGIFDQLPIAHHPDLFERFFRTPQKADVPALGQAMGASVMHITDAAELTQATAVWCANNDRGVHVIHAACDNDAKRWRKEALADCMALLRAQGGEKR